MRGKIYRTAPFHGPNTAHGDQPTLWYWTFEPLDGDPHRGLIRQQEVALSFQMGSLASAALPAGEAIEKLAELEKAAASAPDMRRANDRDYEIFKRLGYQYHDAVPYQQHPAYVHKQHQACLKAHAKTAQSLTPKPRRKGSAPE